MEELVNQLLTVMHARFGMQVVTQNASANQVRLVARVQPNFTRNWLVGAHHMLQCSQREPWNLDLSRQYFLRGELMVWGWRLIFQHPELEKCLPSIIQAVQTSPRARFEVEEQQLPGVTGQRRVMNPETGKGASSAGTPPLLIKQRAGMGVTG